MRLFFRALRSFMKVGGLVKAWKKRAIFGATKLDNAAGD